jgi:hypothetical protein
MWFSPKVESHRETQTIWLSMKIEKYWPPSLQKQMGRSRNRSSVFCFKHYNIVFSGHKVARIW